MGRIELLLRHVLFGAFLLSASTAHDANAQSSPETLPRVFLSDFIYKGAFRLPADEFGGSSLNFSEGPIEYNPDRGSFYLVGHSHHQQIAEFKMPLLVNSTDLDDLNMAGAPLQVFSGVLDRAPSGNPQELNRIGGMKYVTGPNGPELLINAYEYYDAPGDNSHTTLVLRSPNAIAASAVGGFYTLDGGAGHTGGWMSPIPPAWQPLLGGTHITGLSSGIPIISRTSVGPSAFAFNPLSIVGAASVPDPVPTVKLLDFSLDHPLHADLSNDSGNNKLWTHLSRVVYGFILPGSRTYITLGHSGGHESGVCYKCTQNNGNLCGGYCTPDAADNYEHYWLWDVNDLLAVKQGKKSSYDVRPYDYGIFPVPFSTNELGGGSFDSATGTLYLTVQRADDDQGQFANPPVVVAYGFSITEGRPAPPKNLRITGSGFTE